MAMFLFPRSSGRKRAQKQALEIFLHQSRGPVYSIATDQGGPAAMAAWSCQAGDMKTNLWCGQPCKTHAWGKQASHLPTLGHPTQLWWPEGQMRPTSRTLAEHLEEQG